MGGKNNENVSHCLEDPRFFGGLIGVLSFQNDTYCPIFQIYVISNAYYKIRSRVVTIPAFGAVAADQPNQLNESFAAR